MGNVITIDGPSGAGKSTISRILADKIGYCCLDTGAMYRAVALVARRQGVALMTAERWKKFAVPCGCDLRLETARQSSFLAKKTYQKS